MPLKIYHSELGLRLILMWQTHSK